MNFTLMPSLMHMALVKVTTQLWNQGDVRDLVARSSTGYSDYSTKYKEWQQIVERKVMEKVPELPLPELLKEEILYAIKPIGLQIYDWKTYLCENRCLGALLSAEEYTKFSIPCWTPQGTVEKKRTAEAFIKDDSVDITKRYILACNLCLEDDIKEIWNSLPQTKKVAFYDEGHSNFSITHHRLTVFWTYEIKGELTKLNGLFKDDARREISAYQFAFENAAFDNNKTATEYFLQKLTPLERQESFVRYAKYVANRRGTRYSKPLYADVLYFLLSQMNEEQKVKVFEGDPSEVLSSLLSWPWQSFFMNVANRIWSFLSEQDYVLILRNIVTMRRLGFKDWNYQKLFGEFWKQGPSFCKKYFIGICESDGLLLQVLFEHEDKENIRLILNNANVKEKENIIFNFICWRVICTDKWDILKFVIQECLSSEDTIMKFKGEFMRQIGYLSRHKSAVDKFFQLLDDLISKNSKKRDIEEGSSSPAKRLK